MDLNDVVYLIRFMQNDDVLSRVSFTNHEECLKLRGSGLLRLVAGSYRVSILICAEFVLEGES